MLYCRVSLTGQCFGQAKRFFVYATRREPLIYEMRVYEVVPGKLRELNDRFTKITLRFFDKYGMNVVGFWTDEVDKTIRLTYIVAFEDIAHKEKAWAGFLSDQERIGLFAETEKDGPLVGRISSTIMQPTAYSALQ
jgi:hypothetical protein